MRVLLIGAGRYGNDLIGKKYVSGELGVKLAGVIDPKIEEIKHSVSYCLKGVPTYKSIDDVPSKLIRNSVIDIALIPQIVPEIYGKLLDKGAKQVILPKPVVTNTDDFEKMINMTNENNAQALVASNWHYSDITATVKEILSKITGNNFDKHKFNSNLEEKLEKIPSEYKIKKVNVQYNKKNEVLTIDPPLQELPHALQIVYSAGITNLQNVQVAVKKILQSKSRVNAELKNVENVKKSIVLNSDLQMGEKLAKQRERIVDILLENNNSQAKMTIDYDAYFKNGICEKSPSIHFESYDKKNNCNWDYVIEEDNMNTMYNMMLNFFRGENNTSLTLKKYTPISKILCEIQNQWKSKI